MLIGFFFENDFPVGQIMLMIAKQVNQVIEKIKDVERKNKQFDLLPQMNFFVIDNGLIGFQVGTFKQNERENGHALCR